jgi:hypothetical protein
MSRPKQPIPKEIQALRRRVELWRRTRRTKSPMPSELWGAAVAATRVHGVSQVARGAGIGYQGLSQRLGSEGSSPQPEIRTPSSRFVELEPMTSMGGLIAVPPEGAVVELRDGHGLQMTVRLGRGGREVLDVSALVSSLWHRRETETREE